MLSSSLDTLLKVAKTTSPQKLFDYDCVTLYVTIKKTFFKYFTIKYFIYTIKYLLIFSSAFSEKLPTYDSFSNIG